MEGKCYKGSWEGVESEVRVKSYAPLREGKMWFSKCQFLQESLGSCCEERPIWPFITFSPGVNPWQVGRGNRWASGWGLGSPPHLHGDKEVSVAWALQRLAHADQTIFVRRQELPSTFLSYLTMYGWKEDKVCSALISVIERQPRKKVCFHVSGEAEANLLQVLTHESLK